MIYMKRCKHRLTRCLGLATQIQMLNITHTSQTPVPLSAIGLLFHINLRRATIMKTLSIFFVTFLMLIGCKEKSTSVAESLEITLTIQKDTIQTGYIWMYFLSSNYEIVLDSVVCSRQLGTPCGKQYWPFGLKVPSNTPTEIGGEFCSFSEYDNFKGLRHKSVYGTQMQGATVKFSKTIDIMIE